MKKFVPRLWYTFVACVTVAAIMALTPDAVSTPPVSAYPPPASSATPTPIPPRLTLVGRNDVYSYWNITPASALPMLTYSNEVAVGPLCFDDLDWCSVWIQGECRTVLWQGDVVEDMGCPQLDAEGVPSVFLPLVRFGPRDHLGSDRPVLVDFAPAQGFAPVFSIE